MGGDIKLGRIAGFPLSMNWSVFVIAALVTWTLADGLLPDAAPGHSPVTYWATASAAAIVFLGALLAHELSHALVAHRNGVEVNGLTLWMFGGVATLGGESPNAGADLRIAAAGPATSIGLGAAFAGVSIGSHALGASALLVAALGWLSWINILLGIFNLLPGAPLDGGRVLRALLWRRHGDQVRAALTATRAGIFVGFGLIGLGLLQLLAGVAVGGLWLVLIGWFLITAARAEETQTYTGSALAGLRVADVMTPRPVVTPGWITVADFVERYLLGSRHSAYPVEALDGKIAGLITLAQLRQVPPDQRDRTRVGDIAIGLAAIPIAAPDDHITVLLGRLTTAVGGRALVFDGGKLVGIVTPADIVRAAELRGIRVAEHLASR